MKFRHPPRRQRKPRRHRMPAPGRQQPSLPRRNHRRPEINPRHRPPRPLGNPVRHPRHQSRPVESLLDPPGNNPDHPGMPRRPAHQHRRMSRRQLRLRRLHRLAQHPRFHRLALPVHPVQRRRHRPRIQRVVAQQQPQPQPGLANPPAGIDPRPQRKPQRHRADPVLHRRHFQ